MREAGTGTEVNAASSPVFESRARLISPGWGASERGHRRPCGGSHGEPAWSPEQGGCLIMELRRRGKTLMQSPCVVAKLHLLPVVTSQAPARAVQAVRSKRSEPAPAVKAASAKV